VLEDGTLVVVSWVIRVPRYLPAHKRRRSRFISSFLKTVFCCLAQPPPPTNRLKAGSPSSPFLYESFFSFTNEPPTEPRAKQRTNSLRFFSRLFSWLLVTSAVAALVEFKFPPLFFPENRFLGTNHEAFSQTIRTRVF